MKSVYCSWNDAEIIQLFNFVEEEKNKNVNLVNIFKLFAQMTGRQPNSVRNYYYLELKELENNKHKRERLKINLKNHSKINQFSFSCGEKKQLILDILKLSSMGYSVRKACLKLAGGDLNLMIRYQNKYRNTLLNNKKLIFDCVRELKEGGFVVKSPILGDGSKTENVVFMKPGKKALLSDDDINNLFAGLVRLVKKCAVVQANENLKSEAEFANDNLRKALVRLTNTETKLKESSFSILKLKKENQALAEKINYLRTMVVKSPTKNDINTKKNEKYSSLKKFVSKIKGQAAKEENSNV